MKLNKESWRTVKMDEVCNLITDGKHGDCKNEDNSGYYFLSVKDLFNKRLIYDDARQITKPDFEETHRRTNLEVGDVLVSNAGTIGRIAIAEDKEKANKTTFQKSVAVIKPKRDLFNNIFCSFQLEADLDKLVAVSAGTAQKNLLLGDLRNHRFLLPPLEEQKQIASLFLSIETAIEQAENQETRLRKLRKGMVDGLLAKKPVFGNMLSSANCHEVSFEDIANCIEQHDKNAVKNGLTRFIGLENIEPDNFELQGHGNISEGTTFTKRFSKGDVLFGKRRAYLKKVAVADYDGICSGDILVLRAKGNIMLPDLLKYYVAAEAFIAHAVGTSAGSLSPRTKWRDLSSFEISIPDLYIQGKIVSVFKQLESTLSQLKTQRQTLKTLKQTLLNEILG